MAAAITRPRKASHLKEIIRNVVLLICVVVKQYNDNIQGWSTSKNFSNTHLYDIRFGAYPPRELKKSSSRVVSLRPRLYKCDNELELSFHMYRTVVLTHIEVHALLGENFVHLRVTKLHVPITKHIHLLVMYLCAILYHTCILDWWNSPYELVHISRSLFLARSERECRGMYSLTCSFVRGVLISGQEHVHHYSTVR